MEKTIKRPKSIVKFRQPFEDMLEKLTRPDRSWIGNWRSPSDYIANELMRGNHWGDMRLMGIPEPLIEMRNRAFSISNKSDEDEEALGAVLFSLVSDPLWNS